MEHVFICYSRKDRNLALQLKGVLEKAGQNVWIDIEDLPASSIWRAEIQTAITESIAFVFLVSSNSLESEYCQKEIDFASQLNKRIFPILLSGITDKDVPEIISSSQWLTWDSLGENLSNLNKLVRDIETDYEWLKFITELGIRTSRWEKDNSRVLLGKELRETEQKLASAGSLKDPQPTDLQRKFISASRKVEQRRKKTTTSVIIGVSVALCLLCALSITGGGIAYFQSKAKATAQIQAGEQSNIALARQLAAQSEITTFNASDDTTLSGLLAIESLKRYPSLEGDLAIKRVLDILGSPTVSMELNKEITCMAFSSDKKWLATGNSEGLVQVWDIAKGQEIARMLSDGKVTNIAVSSDKKLVILSGLNNSVDVWDIENGNIVNNIYLEGSLDSFIASPDGETIAAMTLLDNGDWVIVIQDISTGFEKFRILTDTGNPITPLAFDTSGNLLAIYDVNKNNEAIVFIWDINLKKEIAKFVSNTSGNWVNTVQFSNNGLLVSSGDRQGSVHVWNIKTGEELFQATMGLPVLNLSFSLNDEYLIGANFCWREGVCDTSISIWEINSGQEIANIQEPGGIYDLDISPNGKYFASAGGDKTARIWDIKNGQEMGRMLYNSYVTTVAFSSDGNSLTSVDGSGNLTVWNLETSQGGAYELHEGYLRSVNVSPDGNTLISVNYDNVVTAISVATGQEISKVNFDTQIYEIKFSPNKEWVALPSAFQDGIIHIWNFTTGDEVTNMVHQGGVGGIAFNPDGQSLISVGGGGFHIWELPSGKEKLYKEFETTGFPDTLGEVVFSPDGNLVAVTLGYSIRILNANTGEEIAKLSSGLATDPTFNLEGNLVASGELYIGSRPCPECFAKVWDVTTGKEIANLSHNGRVVQVQFSPNGKWLLTASQDGIARMWDFSTGQEVSRMTHNNQVEAISFSRDGSLVISGSLDGDVRIWESSTGREIARTTLITDNQGEKIMYVNFNNDNQTALSISESGTIKSWVWQSVNLVSELCARLPRNMTQDEWNDYLGSLPYEPTCPNLLIPSQ